MKKSIITIGIITIIIVILCFLMYLFLDKICLKTKPCITLDKTCNQQIKYIKTNRVILKSAIDTFGWDIYNNTKYYYSIKLAPGWRMTNETSSKEHVSFQKSEDDLVIAYFSIRLVEENTKFKEPIEKAKQIRCSDISEVKCLIYEINDRYYNHIMINNLDLVGDDIFNNSKKDIWMFVYDLIHDNNYYQINYQIVDGDGKTRTDEQLLRAKNEFSEILTTLEFK